MRKPKKGEEKQIIFFASTYYIYANPEKNAIWLSYSAFIAFWGNSCAKQKFFLPDRKVFPWGEEMLFQGLEYMFQDLEHMFQRLEHKFQGLEHKISADGKKNIWYRGKIFLEEK